MGLFDRKGNTQQAYYQGKDYGNYQFTSLDDIIHQFMIAYVGEDKIISKIKRADIAFHAQRAMQELSFDTFKSIKAQEIILPPTLQMILPHDYVNYTKISWSDSSGIKHPLYPTSKTSNPFSVAQSGNNINYLFPADHPVLVNPDFDSPFESPWLASTVSANTVAGSVDEIGIIDGALSFTHYIYNAFGNPMSRAYAAWQEIDVSGINWLEISATGTSAPASGTAANGILYFGLSTIPGDLSSNTAQSQSGQTSTNIEVPDIAYVEWTDGTSSTKSLKTWESVNVSQYTTIYVIIKSYLDHSGTEAEITAQVDASINSIDNIKVTNMFTPSELHFRNNDSKSKTWSNYKSGTPSENQDDYQDDTYWPMDGSRFGLDPQHAQANGSFFIDDKLGKIHFSSNISGKTVILDYISDSLGTNKEMQVHKFAEEAMYKWIAHAILATRANTQEYLVARYKKERFAAIRTAKLRLSNIKLEEITQILRGKSKQIKH